METKDVIFSLRTKNALSQDERAEKLHVTRQAVSRWETGETLPNTESLKLLSGADVAYFAEGWEDARGCRIEHECAVEYGITTIEDYRQATMTDAKREIADMPAADVAPVVHGRWDDSGRYTFPSGDVAVRCTNCGCALTKSEYRLYTWNYCPICGAKMDGGL